jgi:hypothetical protein
MNRFNSFLGIGVMGLMIGLGSISMAACGDDDDDNVAGSAGKAGTAGAAGTAGKSGSGGSGGAGAGGAGAGGAGAGGAGAGGAGAGGAGASGTGGTAGARTEQFALPGDKALSLCKSSGKSVFETYKADALKLGAGAIVDATVADLGKGGGVPDKLGSSFSVLGTPGNLTPDELKTSLGNFLIAAYGGPVNTYTGASMFASHAGLEITKVQYDYFVGSIIVPTVGTLVPADDITSCFAPVLTDPKLVNDIVEK